MSLPHSRNGRMVLAILAVALYSYYISLPTSILRQPSSRSPFRAASSTSSFYYYHDHALTNQSTQRQCRIYVAPSSLKGNPGYGIYTTEPLWKGEPVLGGPDGVAIPVEAYRQRQGPKAAWKSHWIHLWDPYWWGRGVPDHVAYEAGSGDVVDFQIGFGYLPNHHCDLASLDPGYPQDAPYDDSMAPRYSSPGAGAFSYNRGREFVSTRTVQPGEELFMSYGYCDHDDASGPGWTQTAYMPAEFLVAANLLWRRIGPQATQPFDLDETTGTIRYDAREIQHTITETTNETVKVELVQQLSPETPQDAQTLAAAPLTRDTLPQYLARTRGVTPRTPEWIRKHGMCLETLVAQRSTLPHAGQGGFAQFEISKGNMIAMAPLLHILDKDVLAIYDNDDDDDDDDKNDKDATPQPVGTQLLMNYCFSNPHSTVLLCPTTNAVLINHCSKRTKQCGPQGPNADYRWSSGWDPTSEAWRQESLEELAAKRYRGLSFEIYALRDIEPGEEIFMDYGEAWERAWHDHVQHWTPPPPSSSSSTSVWISAAEANAKGGPILPQLVVATQSLTANNHVVQVDTAIQDDYLMTGCVYWVTEMDFDPLYQDTKAWEASSSLTMEQILKQYADDGEEFQYTNPQKGYTQHEDGLHWPCTVLWQEQEEEDGQLLDTYVVQLHPSPAVSEEDLPWAKHHIPRLLMNYPRSSIRYFVKPFASDQHLPGVFRHPIGMRDDIFPNQWKNIQ